MKQGKVWGETSLILRTPLIEVHKLDILEGAFCSWHHHEFKWNAFMVIRGALLIEVRKNDYQLTDVTRLGPGDFTTVRPGEVHRFRTTETASCEAWEIYYPESLGEDIIRESVGGLVEGESNADGK